MTSHWLHDTKHIRGLFSGNLTEYLESEHGLQRFVKHISSWSKILTEDSVIAYEDLNRNPLETFTAICNKLEIEISPEIIATIVQASSIENLQQKEKTSPLAGQEYDTTDPNALRFRKGTIGDHENYFSEQNHEQVAVAIKSLNKEALYIVEMTGYPV